MTDLVIRWKPHVTDADRLREATRIEALGYWIVPVGRFFACHATTWRLTRKKRSRRC